jgi:hypothetical protein
MFRVINFSNSAAEIEQLKSAVNELVTPGRNLIKPHPQITTSYGESAANNLMSTFKKYILNADPYTGDACSSAENFIARIYSWGNTLEQEHRQQLVLPILPTSVLPPSEYTKFSQGTTKSSISVTQSTTDATRSWPPATEAASNKRKHTPTQKLAPCRKCGRTNHAYQVCGFASHPDANNTDLPWDESPNGKRWKRTGRDDLNVKYTFVGPDTNEVIPIAPHFLEKFFKKKGKRYHNISLSAPITYSPHTPPMPLPPCCTCENTSVNEKVLLNAWVGVAEFTDIPTRVLMDTGCLQTNVIHQRLAILLQEKGATFVPVNHSLVPGIGGDGNGVVNVDSIVYFDIILTGDDKFDRKYTKTFTMRALVIEECDFDIIIGLPSIFFFNLLPSLHSKLNSMINMCEICENRHSHPLSSVNTVKIKPDSEDEKVQLLDELRIDGHRYPLSGKTVDELNEIVERMHISEFFDVEDDDDGICDNDITTLIDATVA